MNTHAQSRIQVQISACSMSPEHHRIPKLTKNIVTPGYREISATKRGQFSTKKIKRERRHSVVELYRHKTQKLAPAGFCYTPELDDLPKLLPCEIQTSASPTPSPHHAATSARQSYASSGHRRKTTPAHRSPRPQAAAPCGFVALERRREHHA